MNPTVSDMPRSVVVAALVSVAFAAAALTLLALASPLTKESTLVALLIFGGSALLSSAMGRLRVVTSRLVGLSLLALALMPSFGAGLWWMALPILVLGLASADLSTLVRVVIAMPMVLISLVFNAGTSVSAYFLVGWVVCAAGMLIAANQLTVVNAFRRFEIPHRDAPTMWRRGRRPASALAAILLVTPLAVGFGYSVDVTVPKFAGAARVGRMGGTQTAGYPGLRGSLDVGEPVELSDDIVLRVESDRPLYWRAATYENWNGRAWTSTDRPQTIEWPGGGVRLAGSGLPDPVVPTESIIQNFRPTQAGFDVILGAPEIDVVWAVAESAQVSNNGTIWLGEPLGADAEWTVESTIPIVDAGVLREADEVGFDLVPGVLRYAHEDNVSPEVAELAHNITVDAPTTYDKVRAIEGWIDSNIVYDRNIPSLAEGDDAVTELLFETKIGFCEQIGSALVVMLRSLGIPARLAVGYVPSAQDSQTGEWISRGSDAHAWAEIYFPGVGWQGFDPTAGVALSGDSTVEPGGVVLWRWNEAVRSVAVLSVVLLFVLVIVGLRQLLAWATVPKNRRLQKRFNGCGTQLGYCWTPSMTLTDRADDLIRSGLDGSLVAEVVTYLQSVHYSPHEPGGVSEVERSLKLLEQQCRTVESV